MLPVLAWGLVECFGIVVVPSTYLQFGGICDILAPKQRILITSFSHHFNSQTFTKGELLGFVNLSLFGKFI
jgi:hypothetical protein